MDPRLYFAFVAATLVLTLIPGPNVALIVAGSIAHGTRTGLLTVLGTTSAMIPQLLLTLLGMSTLLTALSDWFAWLKWIGVGYLVLLGVAQWRARGGDLLAVTAEPKPARTIFARGFFVSLTNPKTLLFYGAFFPQFIDVQRDVTGQFLLLAATFVGLATFTDSMWAVAASRARGLLTTRATLRNRLSGSFLIVAALGLALTRKQ